jgi:hypothetical protein
VSEHGAPCCTSKSTGHQGRQPRAVQWQQGPAKHGWPSQPAPVGSKLGLAAADEVRQPVLRAGGVDVSYQIAKYGVWQPNNVLAWPPTAVEDFVAGLRPGRRLLCALWCTDTALIHAPGAASACWV